MSALAQAVRSLPRMLSPELLIDLPASAEVDAVDGLLLLDELFAARRLLPSEHQLLHTLLLKIGRSH